MFDEKTKKVSRLLLVLDMLIAVVVFLFSYHIREFLPIIGNADYFSHMSLIPMIVVLLAFFLSYFGAYQGLKITSVLGYAGIAARAIAASLAILMLMLFLFEAKFVSRLIIGLFVATEFVVLLSVRVWLNWWYFKKSVEKRENYIKVLVFGTGERAQRLSEKLVAHSEWGVEIVGYLDTDSEKIGSTIGESPVIGTLNNISAILKDHVVDEVIVAVPRGMIGDMQSIADVCEEEGVKLRFMADVIDLQVARMKLDTLGDIPILSFEPVALNEKMLFVKRIIDLMVTLAAMPVILPLMLVIAILVKIDSPGPIFFVQQRVGLRKRKFPMLKFRSMYIGSEEKIKELEHLNEAEGPNFKITNDPRITRVGKLLRKTSLDELPQLLNVIRGHMSLVGPRPMSIRDVDLFDKGVQRKRFSVRPGLTCIWQISGRSNLSFSKWIELDLQYIENWSLGLDLKILLKTIPVVLKGSGAV